MLDDNSSEDDAKRSLLVKKTSFSISQRIVAENIFYKAGRARLESAREEGGDNNNDYENLKEPPDGYFQMWLAKVLSFLESRMEPLSDNILLHSYNTKNYFLFPDKYIDTELFFVHFYKALDWKSLTR